jgi:hypothetical protein
MRSKINRKLLKNRIKSIVNTKKMKHYKRRTCKKYGGAWKRWNRLPQQAPVLSRRHSLPTQTQLHLMNQREWPPLSGQKKRVLNVPEEFSHLKNDVVTKGMRTEPNEAGNNAVNNAAGNNAVVNNAAAVPFAVEPDFYQTNAPSGRMGLGRFTAKRPPNNFQGPAHYAQVGNTGWYPPNFDPRHHNGRNVANYVPFEHDDSTKKTFILKIDISKHLIEELNKKDENFVILLECIQNVLKTRVFKHLSITETEEIREKIRERSESRQQQMKYRPKLPENDSLTSSLDFDHHRDLEKGVNARTNIYSESSSFKGKSILKSSSFVNAATNILG